MRVVLGVASLALAAFGHPSVRPAEKHRDDSGQLLGELQPRRAGLEACESVSAAGVMAAGPGAVAACRAWLIQEGRLPARQRRADADISQEALEASHEIDHDYVRRRLAMGRRRRRALQLRFGKRGPGEAEANSYDFVRFGKRGGLPKRDNSHDYIRFGKRGGQYDYIRFGSSLLLPPLPHSSASLQAELG